MRGDIGGVEDGGDRFADLHAREAHRLGERAQQQVEAHVGLELLGDVVEGHDVAVDILSPAMFAEERHHVGAQADVFAGGEHEAGLGVLLPFLHGVPQDIDGVNQRFALDDAEDRASEAEVVFGTLQQLLGLGVVEQDLARSVADQDPLGELRHQRGEPVALVLQLLFGLLDLRVDFGLELFKGLGGLVDDLRQLSELLGAVRGDAVAGVDDGDHLGLFGEAQGRDDVVAENHADQAADDPEQDQRAENLEGDHFVDQPGHEASFVHRKRVPHGDKASEHRAAHGNPDREQEDGVFGCRF